LLDAHISKPVAKDCIKNYRKETEYWLKAKDHDSNYKKAKSKAGYLVDAIKGKWTSSEYEAYLEKETTINLQKKQLQVEAEEKRRQELEAQEEKLKLDDFYNSLSRQNKEKIEADILNRLKKEIPFLYDKYKSEGLSIGVEATLKSYRYDEIRKKLR